MKEIIPIACDHAGYELKKQVVKHLLDKGFEVKDFGTDSSESVDYPDFAHQVGRAINNGEFKSAL